MGEFLIAKDFFILDFLGISLANVVQPFFKAFGLLGNLHVVTLSELIDLSGVIFDHALDFIVKTSLSFLDFILSLALSLIQVVSQPIFFGRGSMNGSGSIGGHSFVTLSKRSMPLPSPFSKEALLTRGVAISLTFPFRRFARAPVLWNTGLMSETLVFIGGKRTPFGANGGSLKGINPSDLSVAASKAALEQAKVKPDEIDHVIFGNVLHSAADSIYTPRHTGLKLGIPIPVPALGINRLCGSGFQVVVEAFHQMLAGDSKIALVGGVENMSMAPYVVRGARWGMKMGNQELEDSMVQSLTDSYTGSPMGITAENLATQYKISRAECDEFALRSQKLCKEAIAAGRFADEIAPFITTDRKGAPLTISADEHPKPETTMETLQKLKSVFKKEGTVTAASASGIVDGAAALVVTTASEAAKRGSKPLGRMISYGIAGCDPKIMGIGPVPAAKIALERAGMKLDQMDLIEVNEAFAPQTLAVAKELGIPMEKLNVNGGAIAIGHPLAASGTRIIMTLLYELRRRGKKYGLASACIGGGQGIAVILEAFP